MRLWVEETEDYYIFLSEGGKEEDFYFDQGPRLPDYEMWAGREVEKEHNSSLKQTSKQRRLERKKRHPG